MLIGCKLIKLRKLEVVIPKEFGKQVGFEPKVKVVTKSCYVSYITKGHVGLKNRPNTVIRALFISNVATTVLLLQGKNKNMQNISAYTGKTIKKKVKLQLEFSSVLLHELESLLECNTILIKFGFFSQGLYS